MNTLFLQTAEPSYASLLECTSRTVREYCSRHDCSYESYFGIVRGYYAWHATYNRIPLLKRLADGGYCGWVCYLDADAYICDLDFDLGAFLRDKAEFALIIAPAGTFPHWWNVNAGVFLINLEHATGQAIVREWSNTFAEITDTQLREAALWSQVPDDQALLSRVLQTIPGCEQATLVLRQYPRIINYLDGTFIKQVLRVVGDLEKRALFLRTEIERLLGCDAVEPVAQEKCQEKDLHEAFIKAMYRVLLLREPDPGGLVNGVTMMRAGMTFEEAMRSYLRSVEFAEKYQGVISKYVPASLVGLQGGG